MIRRDFECDQAAATRQPRADVVVVRTGSANLASVLAGLRRAGASPRVSDDSREVADAPALVLPGVGSFGAAMEHLRRRGLDGPVRAHAMMGRPLLAICLGLQALCRESEESPGVRGLDLLACEVRRFPSSVRVPQLGWNCVRPLEANGLLEPGHAYFANSYRLIDAPAGWGCATSRHGGEFIAALVRGPILACQFHPELSGDYGLRLLRRWLAAARPMEAAPC